jgi:hypothetical protein
VDTLNSTRRYQNKLLALLPESDVLHLMPLFVLGKVQAKDVLVGQGHPIRHPAASVMTQAGSTLSDY